MNPIALLLLIALCVALVTCLVLFIGTLVLRYNIKSQRLQEVKKRYISKDLLESDEYTLYEQVNHSQADDGIKQYVLVMHHGRLTAVMMEEIASKEPFKSTTIVFYKGPKWLKRGKTYSRGKEEVLVM